MSDLTNQELELRLKADLDEAEQVLRHATPEEKPEARRHFKEALHNFTTWAVEGKVPLSLVHSKSKDCES